LIDSLGDPARAHFDGLQQLLGDQGIRFTINPRLVRGLDYYNRTVFEWVTDRLGAQGTVAGGGRYDGLFEQLGGKPTPACGFAIGSERMVLLLQDAGIAPAAVLDAYVVHVGAEARRLALAVAEMLRDAGLSIAVNAGGGSFKAQMKKADVSGARFALIVGEDEAAANRVAMKPLRSAGDQLTLEPAELAARLAAHSRDGAAR
jgi:histidyl-tRNA synthetase